MTGRKETGAWRKVDYKKRGVGRGEGNKRHLDQKRKSSIARKKQRQSDRYLSKRKNVIKRVVRIGWSGGAYIYLPMARRGYRLCSIYPQETLWMAQARF